MDVTEDVAATLRAENHGHPPCVMGAAGFCTEHSAQARGIGYEEETSPTLRAGTVPAAVYENHSQDTRYTGPLETAPTVNATYGMGGNNQPFVVETPKMLFMPFVKGTRPHSPDEGQQWKASDVANTLNTYDVGEVRCNELAVKVYGICSKQSHAMLSDNPKSGFYEAETSRCLDANGGNPTCNQGGMAVVALQGSMIGRADKNGSQGSGVNEDVSFTLDAADHHAVAYCMTNRENVSWLVQNYRWDFDTVVIDELSSFKSNQAQRFKAMKKVRPLVNRVIGLTGTPAPNSLLDLWPQMYLLDMGQRLGRFITGYRERFFTPDKRNREIIYSYKPREGAEKAIYFLISDICISMKAVDYLDMPECIYNRVEVEMSRKERKSMRISAVIWWCRSVRKNWMRSAQALFPINFYRWPMVPCITVTGKSFPSMTESWMLWKIWWKRPMGSRFWWLTGTSMISSAFRRGSHRPGALTLQGHYGLECWEDPSGPDSSCFCRTRVELTGGRMHHRLVWPDMVTGIVPAAERQTVETGTETHGGDPPYHHQGYP